MIRWRRLRLLACALLAGSVIPAFYLDSVLLHPMRSGQAPKRTREALLPEASGHNLAVLHPTDAGVPLAKSRMLAPSWTPSGPPSHGQLAPRSHGQLALAGSTETLVITELPFVVPKERRYTLEEGDTLGAVAAVFGVRVEDIVMRNAILNPNLVQPGQQVTRAMQQHDATVHTADSGTCSWSFRPSTECSNHHGSGRPSASSVTTSTTRRSSTLTSRAASRSAGDRLTGTFVRCMPGVGFEMLYAKRTFCCQEHACRACRGSCCRQ